MLKTLMNSKVNFCGTPARDGESNENEGSSMHTKVDGSIISDLQESFEYDLQAVTIGLEDIVLIASNAKKSTERDCVS